MCSTWFLGTLCLLAYVQYLVSRYFTPTCVCTYVLAFSHMQTTSAVYLKANLEYQRGNYRKAMKVLASAPKTPILTDAGECLPSFYYNNLGCIHSQMGKHCLSSHYFKKALEENDTAVNDFPPQDKGEGQWCVYIRTYVCTYLCMYIMCL